MYNTNKGAFTPAGACPASHPVRMPQLAYETMWDTRQFNNKADWPADGSQPFVWSYEDSKVSYNVSQINPLICNPHVSWLNKC